MIGYKIYLTKSCEVAHLLSAAKREDVGTGKLAATSSGSVEKDCRIPALYHDKGYYFCILEYRGLDNSKYEIIFA